MTGEQLQRLRDLGTRLGASADLLNASITDAETALSELKLGVRASVSTGELVLTFGKKNDQWRLLVGHEGAEQALVSASRKARVAAVSLLPQLFESLVTKAEAELAALYDAKCATDKFTSELSNKE